MGNRYKKVYSIRKNVWNERKWNLNKWRIWKKEEEDVIADLMIFIKQSNIKNPLWKEGFLF